MIKCSFCKTENAYAEIKDNKTKKLYYTCSFCEPDNIELIRLLPNNNNIDTSTIKKVSCDINEIKTLKENEDIYGRLHLVKKTRTLNYCRECLKEIPIGSECYNQSFQNLQTFFPVQTKVCKDCGEKQIQKGVEVVEK